MINDIYAGQIGNFLARPIHVSAYLAPGRMIDSPMGIVVSPADYWKLHGHTQWKTRLRGHPAASWVALGSVPEVLRPRRRRWLDRLLPGWRIREGTR